MFRAAPIPRGGSVAIDRETVRRMADAVVIDRLGLPLIDWVADQRDAGKSWEKIARDLEAATSGIVSVSYKTLIRWFGEGEAA